MFYLISNVNAALANNLTPVTAKQELIELLKGIIEGFIKKLRNEKSLICRVGNGIFTGDAPKRSLKETFPIIHSRRGKISSHFTIKISHHGSATGKYKYLDFYNSLNPTQLLLKRDYQVQRSKNFTSYYRSLRSIQTVENCVDSAHSKKPIIRFRF